MRAGPAGILASSAQPSGPPPDAPTVIQWDIGLDGGPTIVVTLTGVTLGSTLVATAPIWDTGNRPLIGISDTGSNSWTVHLDERHSGQPNCRAILGSTTVTNNVGGGSLQITMSFDGNVATGSMVIWEISHGSLSQAVTFSNPSGAPNPKYCAPAPGLTDTDGVLAFKFIGASGNARYEDDPPWIWAGLGLTLPPVSGTSDRHEAYALSNSGGFTNERGPVNAQVTSRFDLGCLAFFK